MTQHHNIVNSVIAGGTAGICEVLIMYPLDVVKTRSQLSKEKSLAVFKQLGGIIKSEGVPALYRGIISPILAEAPKRAMKFTANEIYKPFFSDKNNKLNWWRSGLAGAAAGATETFINCPFEVIKVRMQSKENKTLYKNTMDAVIKVGSKEGPLALYKGFEAQLLRNMVWNGAYFAIIPTIKSFLGNPTSKYDGWFKAFLSGALGGGIATTLNTPFDVVKSRMQNQKSVEEIIYRWSVPSLFKIYREEGLKALYKGYAARMYRLAPGGGIMVCVFDIVAEFIEEKQHKQNKH